MSFPNVEFVQSSAKYQPELTFSLIKQNDQVVGFIIANKETARDDVRRFCQNLPHAIKRNWFELKIMPGGESLMLYDKEYLGQTLLRFPIKTVAERQQLKSILEARQNVKIKSFSNPKNGINGLELTAQ